MASENKDKKIIGWVGTVVSMVIAWLSENKDKNIVVLLVGVGMMVIAWLICTGISLSISGITYIIQTDTVKEIYDPCSYPVGKVLNITIPSEKNILMATYETSILQKKTHCDENLLIYIVDKVFIPRDFIGTLRIEITKIRSPYRYSAKIIHIKPNKRITE